jgi:hypothetical protein
MIKLKLQKSENGECDDCYFDVMHTNYFGCSASSEYRKMSNCDNFSVSDLEEYIWIIDND